MVNPQKGRSRVARELPEFVQTLKDEGHARSTRARMSTSARSLASWACSSANRVGAALFCSG
jgi:hypothetical protein